MLGQPTILKNPILIIHHVLGKVTPCMYPIPIPLVKGAWGGGGGGGGELMYVCASNQSGSSVDSPLLQGSYPQDSTHNY